jgi:galactokinase
LPFACDLEIRCQAEPNPGEVVLISTEQDDEVRLPVLGDVPAPDGWGRHVWGVIRALREAGAEIEGLRGIVDSTIPAGAGLSSSTALEVVVALALTGGARPAPEVLQRAEQEATGVPCGVMDQATLLGARAGHAILLDCGTGERTDIPIPAAFGFVVIDTGTRRDLSDGRYAQRRAEVEGGDLRRRRHADSEQQRVFDAVDALHNEDSRMLGAILRASHESLRDDFEVSSPALDSAAERISAHDACTGARLVGAGFAGCVLAAVDGGREDEIVSWASDNMPDCRAIKVRAVDAAAEVGD